MRGHYETPENPGKPLVGEPKKAPEKKPREASGYWSKPGRSKKLDAERAAKKKG